jgi:hypothetical protein
VCRADTGDAVDLGGLSWLIVRVACWAELLEVS